MATREETLTRKRHAYVLFKQGKSAVDIGKEMGLSERMIYRYIDEFELVQLRAWKKAVDEALTITPATATVSQLLKVIKSRK